MKKIYIKLLKAYIRIADGIQRALDIRGFMFADSYALMRRLLIINIMAVTLWSVEYLEFKLNNQAGTVLPFYMVIFALLIGLIIIFADLLLGREDYEIMRYNESLQIHRLCVFLDGYKELGREEVIKWILKITKWNYAVYRRILLCLETGREPDWKKAEGIDTGGRYLKAGADASNITCRRIFEHIRRMDELGNSGAEKLLKGQLDYADKAYYEHLDRLIRIRVLICKTAAYLPVFCTIIFYMIYPFVLEGIRLLNTYSAEMELLNKL